MTKTDRKESASDETPESPEREPEAPEAAAPSPGEAPPETEATGAAHAEEETRSQPEDEDETLGVPVEIDLLGSEEEESDADAGQTDSDDAGAEDRKGALGLPVEIDLMAPAEAEETEEESAGAVVEEIEFGEAREEDETPEAEPLEIEEELADVEEVAEEEKDRRTPAEIMAAVECLLFTTHAPLSVQRLRKIVGRIDTRTIRGVVGQLQAEYDARSGGLQIIEGAEGYMMCTRPEHAAAILQLHRQRKKNPLSTTALETLAIIAYKQPMTRAEIEMIRGVESSGVVRNLADMGLVKVVGRKEVIGRPQLYGTTSVFLRTFGLKAISELPTVENLRRRFGSALVRPMIPEPPADIGDDTALPEPEGGVEVLDIEAEPSHAPPAEAASQDEDSPEPEPDIEEGVDDGWEIDDEDEDGQDIGEDAGQSDSYEEIEVIWKNAEGEVTDPPSPDAKGDEDDV